MHVLIRFQHFVLRKRHCKNNKVEFQVQNRSPFDQVVFYLYGLVRSFKGILARDIETDDIRSKVSDNFKLLSIKIKRSKAYAFLHRYPMKHIMNCGFTVC